MQTTFSILQTFLTSFNLDTAHKAVWYNIHTYTCAASSNLNKSTGTGLAWQTGHVTNNQALMEKFHYAIQPANVCELVCDLLASWIA